MEDSLNQRSSDWLLEVWASMSYRSRDVLMRRQKGQILSAIGCAHRVTSERARQLINQSSAELLARARDADPNWLQSISKLLADAPAVHDRDVEIWLPDGPGMIRRIILHALGYKHPITWAGPLSDFWTAEPSALEEQLRELANYAPCPSDEFLEYASSLGIPDSVSVEGIMTAAKSPLVQVSTGLWVRRRKRIQDLAYLWLSEQGQPSPAIEIAEKTDVKVQSLSNSLRRDARFRQLRPEGTWALASWPLPGVSKHSNTLDVMVEVLTELGALDKRALFAEVQRRYPVSYARVQQCLISDKIGVNEQGLLDLVERGARLIEESEPRRPRNVSVQGRMLGILFPVTEDLDRGSGIPISTWITWHLGLRQAPTSMSFSCAHGVVAIKRGTSGAQISSLRKAARALGLVPGCELVVMLNLDDKSAAVIHACQPARCPRGAATRGIM